MTNAKTPEPQAVSAEPRSHSAELRKAAEEIRAGRHNGWGNTCADAADFIERLTQELYEECRLNGMGSEREASLMAQVNRLTRERDEARAEAERCKGAIAMLMADASEVAQVAPLVGVPAPGSPGAGNARRELRSSQRAAGIPDRDA
jgi:hypothetical protein